jgi:hypothetical protein
VQNRSLELAPTQADEKLSLTILLSAPNRSIIPAGANRSGADEKLPLTVLLSASNRSVIPTGAKRSGGTCCSSSASSNLTGSAALPFVIPSEAEGSAVPHPNNQLWLEAPPSPLSSRPERSAVEGSAVPRTPPGNVFRHFHQF